MTPQVDSARLRRLLAGAGVAVVAAGLLATPPGASAAPNTVSPVLARRSTGVTADGLPTAQINGVAWSQVVVGNTVYVGGKFTSARPAGAPLGTSETPRGNLLAYDITTGVLDPNFAPMANAQVKTVAVSPDGTRLYVGGSFTSVDGVNRYRIAAFDTATGALVTTFRPILDATVDSITATNSVVYASGVFGTANGNPRSRLAAFSAADGSLLNWAPTTDGEVQAILLSPKADRVIIGGAFTSIDGQPAAGSASLDPVSGTREPWAVANTVQDNGPNAAILNLSTDGTYIYGGGYTYGQPASGNFEGIFAADPETGQIAWLADCHGDTYGAYSSGGTVYSVGHHHFCSNIGGFPDLGTNAYRADAFTKFATGTVQKNTMAGTAYGNFAGQPSPSLINWLPVLSIGTFTMQNQAAWTLTGNSQYVVVGGEFPRVNNVPQQGLVRFAVPSIAPDKQGPVVLKRTAFAPTATVTSANTVTLSFPTVYDPDDLSLVYKVIRSDQPNQPICTATLVSLAWAPQRHTCTDNSVTSGSSYSYHVTVRDASGNRATSSSTAVAAATHFTVASDDFSRGDATGWGDAPIGGAWDRRPKAAHTYLTHQVGRITLRRPGAGGSETLGAMSTQDPDIVVDSGLTAPATGGATTLSIVARQTGAGSYRLNEIFRPHGVVRLALVRVLGSRRTTLRVVTVRHVRYVARRFLSAQFTLTTSGSSTALTGTLWPAGSTEPSAPQLTATDSTRALAHAGSMAFASYQSNSSTTPLAANWDNVGVTAG